MFPDEDLFSQDVMDEIRLGGMQPGVPGKAWWENLLEMGATRAIDSHFDNQELRRMVNTQQTIGFQGANGYTYRPGVQPQVLGGANIGGISLTTWLIIGVVGFAVVKLAD